MHLSCELQSKLLVSLLINPILLPYITPLRSSDYCSFEFSVILITAGCQVAGELAPWSSRASELCECALACKEQRAWGWSVKEFMDWGAYVKDR